jgi:hypothetical protein
LQCRSFKLHCCPPFTVENEIRQWLSPATGKLSLAKLLVEDIRIRLIANRDKRL